MRNWLIEKLIGLFSRMPFGMLYLFSDVACFFVHRVARYRLKVVRRNLTASFPEKSRRELREIESEFYRGFTDYIVETVKYRSISAEKLRQRMTFENLALIDRYFAEGKDVVAYFSHCGNWEWVTLMGLHAEGHTNQCLCEVYRPLKDKFMDRLMLDIRTRFNTRCFKKSFVFKDLVRMRRDGVRFCCGFMSDQKPSHGDESYVVEFLNQPTAVITGTELVARKLRTAVVYFDMTRQGRGRYHLRVVPMADDASELPPHALTDKYIALLQANIRRQPSLWLWSHKRWKKPVTLPPTLPPTSATSPATPAENA